MTAKSVGVLPTNSTDTPSRVGASLAIHWPVGTTIWLALAVLFVLGGALETTSRVLRSTGRLPQPALGSSHRHFEIQYALLEALAGESGPLDCIFLGNSTVYRGINSEEINLALARSGRPAIRCFTFGVQGLAPAFAPVVAKILIDEFRPTLLIYGTDMPSYYEEAGQASERSISQTPWVQHRLGSSNPEGWLIDISLSYRYLLLTPNWFRENYNEWIERSRVVEDNTTRFGFRHSRARQRGVNDPIDALDTPLQRLEDFEVSRRQIDGLEALMRLEGVEIVLLEMPVHDSFIAYFPDGKLDYELAVSTVRTAAEEQSVPFYATIDSSMILDEGWLNRNHLNSQGAQIFSSWLAEIIFDT